MTSIASARTRVEYCRNELARFESYATDAEPDQLMLCRLARDLLLAEADLAAAEAPLPPDYLEKEKARFAACDGERDRWQP